jgi:hypothetical protein
MLRYTYIDCFIVILQVLFRFIYLTWRFRVSEKLLSVTMESEFLRLKTECEIFFPPLLILRCIAVKLLKPFFSNKAFSCCYNTEPEYEKLLDWYWHGQIAAFPERPLTVPSCPQKIPQYPSWDLTWISTARRPQLIACQMLQTALPFTVCFWDEEFNLEQSLNAFYTIILYTLLSENNAETLL